MAMRGDDWGEGWTRRQFVRGDGFGMLGLSLPRVLAARPRGG
jgi:hypothetical protein